MSNNIFSDDFGEKDEILINDNLDVLWIEIIHHVNELKEIFIAKKYLKIQWCRIMSFNISRRAMIGITPL